MHFSEESLNNILEERGTVHDKFHSLMMSYVSRNYENSHAREFAIHGFARRIKTLARCIHNVFEMLPPDRVDLPTGNELSDAVINIHAFLMNVFGSIDNLAWVWVLERGLTKENGSPLSYNLVGLGRGNELVRNSFPREFQEHLNGLNDWFDHQSNYRHALAHRIPLYVPPYMVPDDRESTYKELENQMSDALGRLDLNEHERLSAEQEGLATFMPIMKHSFEEQSPFMWFHPQMLADFNTVEELGRKILEELDR